VEKKVMYTKNELFKSVEMGQNRLLVFVEKYLGEWSDKNSNNHPN
jgi:hypothetical protein